MVRRNEFVSISELSCFYQGSWIPALPVVITGLSSVSLGSDCDGSQNRVIVSTGPVQEPPGVPTDRCQAGPSHHSVHAAADQRSEFHLNFTLLWPACHSCFLKALTTQKFVFPLLLFDLTLFFFQTWHSLMRATRHLLTIWSILRKWWGCEGAGCCLTAGVNLC